MNKINYSITAILIILTIACEKQEPVQKTEYMFHCLMIEGEAPKIKVWKTLPTFPEYAFDILYFDQNGLTYNKDFEDSGFSMNIKSNNTIYNNFETKDIEIENPNGGYPPNGNSAMNYLTNNEIDIKPGDDFEMQVEIFRIDYSNNTETKTIIETLKAKTTIPSRVEINLNQQEDTYPYLNYDISFNDPEDENDYYYLLVYSIQPGNNNINNLNLDSLWLNYDNNPHYNYNYEVEQPQITYLINNFWDQEEISGLESDTPLYQNGVLFNDEQFNGSKKKITLKYNNNFKPSEYLFIDLLHVNEEYYRYYYTLYKQNEWKEENLYAEPVQLYTNIENGLGVFAGASLSRQILKIESKPQ